MKRINTSINFKSAGTITQFIPEVVVQNIIRQYRELYKLYNTSTHDPIWRLLYDPLRSILRDK